MASFGAPENDELVIVTGGRRLGGWTSFRVVRGIELLPSYCLIELTERYPNDPGLAVVTPFAPCEAYLGPDRILTGFIDVDQPEYDANGHSVSIACRSKTEDLVDCSIDVEALSVSTGTWEIRATTIGQAVRRVAEPFGIKVVLPDGDRPLDPRYPFIVAPGMTAYQIIEEMARSVQLLVWDDANGQLVLSAAGTKRASTALIEGQNIEIGKARLSGDQRYRRVVMLGQATTTDNTGPHVPIRAESVDKGVPRSARLLMIVTDLPGPDAKWAKQRADWEGARRYGRSRRASVTVTGWRQGDGTLWQPNTLVVLRSPALKFDEDLLIWQVQWVRSDRGTETVLDLMPRAGVLPAPFVFRAPVTLDPNVSR